MVSCQSKVRRSRYERRYFRINKKIRGGRKDEDKEDEKDRQVSASVEKGLRNKVDQHNEQVKIQRSLGIQELLLRKLRKYFYVGSELIKRTQAR